MVAITQINANKKNALKSTGPKTISGKEISSKNSLKHGLLSKDLIIREETASELKVFKNNLYSSLMPVGCIEELLVEKIINSAWRLKRILEIEKELFNKKAYPEWEQLSQSFKGFNGDCMTKIYRYESMLERNFYKALHELQRIQGIRLGQDVLAPISIDINSPE